MSKDTSAVVTALRSTFLSGRTKNLKWRKNQLSALANAVVRNRDRICEALAADLRKPSFESNMMEIDSIIGETRYALKHVDTWAKPRDAERNFLTMMNEVYVQAEPLGVCLIIGAWNYPLQLCLSPLISAIAAGNAAIVKPSELTPSTAAIIELIVKESLDEDAFRVINGGAEAAKALLDCRFDHILYTGGTRVGRIVMEAAAKNLTPVVLELGGKCPVFVHTDADIDITAKRIIWGKYTNAGQTCLAPDYIITTREVQQLLIPALKRSLAEMYGDNIEMNKDYGRIVNDNHFKRLQSLVQSCGSKIVAGGKMNASTRFIEPTIVADVIPTDEVMKDEIFGPILPILIVDGHNDAISHIVNGEKPLALYLFTKDNKLVELFKTSTSSGALTVNDVVMHTTLYTLPFGGIGNSGMGSYHGQFGFDAFSHLKPVYRTKLAQESFNVVRCAPYSNEKLSVIQWVGDSEQSSRCAKPCSWCYLLTGFLVRLARLPKHQPQCE